jgi:hypothetical protein
MKNKILGILNAIGVTATLVVNTLAAVGAINGIKTGELSNKIPNLFVPAGLTFSIWGVIYLFLIGYAVYQLIAAFRKDMPEYFSRISWFFILASVENCAWIFAWQYQHVFVSLLIMIALFVTLLIIYHRLEIPRIPVAKRDRWFVQLPFSVYIGWITVATIANVTAWLVQIGWNGFGIPAVVWTILVLAVAVAITVAMLLSKKDVAYSLVVLWAFLGIAIKRLNAPVDFKADVSTPVGIAAIIGMGVIVVAIFLSGFRKNKTI